MTTYQDKFRPTFLYIKRHKITGVMYFGKTYQKDPTKYPGSGKRWKLHRAKHGDHIETLWYCLFLDQEELSTFALMFSDIADIVKSREWANLVPENGLDGNPPGMKMSDEQRKKMSESGKRRPPITEETRAKLKAPRPNGKPRAKRGPPSDETRAKMRATALATAARRKATRQSCSASLIPS